MRGRDHADVIGGALLVVFGLAVAFYASANYDLGTARRMGPGMFPAALGYMQAALGFAILVNGMLKQGGPLPRPDLRSAATIIGGGAIFAMIVGPFGVVPAIVLTTVVAAAADRRLSLARAVLLGLVLAAAAALTFRVGLGIRMSLFDWPF